MVISARCASFADIYLTSWHGNRSHSEYFQHRNGSAPTVRHRQPRPSAEREQRIWAIRKWQLYAGTGRTVLCGRCIGGWVGWDPCCGCRCREYKRARTAPLRCLLCVMGVPRGLAMLCASAGGEARLFISMAVVAGKAVVLPAIQVCASTPSIERRARGSCGSIISYQTWQGTFFCVSVFHTRACTLTHAHWHALTCTLTRTQDYTTNANTRTRAHECSLPLRAGHISAIGTLQKLLGGCHSQQTQCVHAARIRHRPWTAARRWRVRTKSHREISSPPRGKIGFKKLLECAQSHLVNGKCCLRCNELMASLTRHMKPSIDFTRVCRVICVSPWRHARFIGLSPLELVMHRWIMIIITRCPKMVIRLVRIQLAWFGNFKDLKAIILANWWCLLWQRNISFTFDKRNTCTWLEKKKYHAKLTVLALVHFLFRNWR